MATRRYVGRGKKVSRQDRKDWVNKIKEAPCMDCGQSFPPECMDFDHRPGVDKKFSIALSFWQNRSFESIIEEIEKCDLVCANCHRIRTRIRREK